MRKYRRGMLLLAAVVLFPSFNISAQNTLPYYKSLFMLKFIKYINWSKAPSQYNIGVIGNSPAIPYMSDMVRNKLINNKKVILTKVSSYEHLDRFSVLFIPKNQINKFPKILGLTKDKPVIIITENGMYIRNGAGISFYMEGEQLKFSLNKSDLEKRGLRVSTRLLAVAKVVD